MSSVRVDIRPLHTIIRELPDGIDGTAFGIAEVLRTDMIESMRNSPATGISYRRGQRIHIASSPGNPPRPDTGRLIGSIILTKPARGRRIVAVPVGYARELEYGRTRVAARPFARPALARMTPAVIRQIAEANLL